MIVFQTPTHGNLGDQAIAYAQKEYIKMHFRNYKYIEIPYRDVLKSIRSIKNILGSEDVIFIHGGGNMGDLYFWEESMRRYIIKKLKNHFIISFPQTFSYSSSIIGKIELRKSCNIYSKCKNLLLVARETESYRLMKQHFVGAKIVITPDIVLSLNKKKEDRKRSGLLLCFRNDEEQFIDDDFKKNLIKFIKSKYKKIQVSDTVINKEVNSQNRSRELNILWEKFRNSEVVLTDRLHGMIFSVITCTPCIVFNNYNHKIKSTYQDWLKDIPFIRFVDLNEYENTNTNEVFNLIAELKHIKQNECTINFNKEFETLTQYIRKLV
ncbi:polysaccharide pyruvyl transferase family protein [Sporolactobacillus sp. CPB3-1]|uniref:Polysaccharide pyruvyl transferase family protein n=1 Tax=Sporolactobacillus mangiferae TaxID=2940498 RepID=A0ABT0M8H2_9BACL|nr:polysaccharide pyruvyl transferase family protein [Sporolactobacillus mangiferae]MCL1631167.1 polysaccharide pyruvyl transferase family protein [Sporolactobacillus mangiferae]